MSASSSQKKMLELLLETREFDAEVVEAVEMIMEDQDLSSAQVLELLNVLMSAKEDDESEVHVGGIIRR